MVLVAISGPSQAQELPLPTEWSTHFAWFLIANPDYTSSSATADSILSAQHIQYQLLLVEEGKAIAAGGFGPLPGDSIVGMTILRANTKEEAIHLAEGDPAVRAGRLLAVVREWWVPTEQLK